MTGLTLGQNMALSGVNGLIGIGNTMLQNHYNKQLAEYQNDYNFEMWHRQNEYNSPKETMNRLVEAGINPRAYQQIGQFANAGSPQPAAQMSKTSELSAFQSVVRQGLENQLLSEQVKQARTRTNLFNEQLGTEFSRKTKNFADILIDLISNGVDISKLDGEIATYFGEDAFGDLVKYIQTGSKPTNPYLYKHFLGNLLTRKGVNLRQLEYELKEIEKTDYDEYGIRGTSDFMNGLRIIKKLFNL